MHWTVLNGYVGAATDMGEKYEWGRRHWSKIWPCEGNRTLLWGNGRCGNLCPCEGERMLQLCEALRVHKAEPWNGYGWRFF
jgi:hypothetical protein